MRKGKRIFSLILSTCLMVTSLPMIGTANTVNNVSRQMAAMGDVDSDGNIDLQDVLVMEKYIAGEKNTKIDQLRADINVDGVIDETDVQLVKDYLVGNIDTLQLEICTVTFDTNGGDEIAPITVGKGYSIKSDIPSPAKDGAVFAGWKKSDGSTFYQADAVTGNMTLKAIYEEVSYVEQLNIDSFALIDQEADVSFSVKGDFESAEEVWNNITLVPKDGKDPVEIEVTEEADGIFSISAKETFTPGGSYALTLDEGLDFAEKDSAIRTANFIIKKEAEDSFVFNNSLIFVKDTEEMKYSLDHEVGTYDMIDVAFLSNDESGQDIISGEFNMTDGDLSVGDVVCIYENVDPRERDYTKNNYDDDRMAYIRIVDVDGSKYSFESLSSEDAEEVIMMPDSIPFKVDTLPTGDEGTVNKNDYDTATRVIIGKTEAPEYNVGDFLIFYEVEFDLANENTEVVYAQVTGTDGDTVSYKIVTKDYIDDFMGMFVRNEVKAEEILENIDQEKVLEQIEDDAKKSGFVDEVIPSVVQSAMESDKTIRTLQANGFSDVEIKSLKTMARNSNTSSKDGKLEFFVEYKDVDAQFGRGNRYKESYAVVLWVDLILSVNRKDGDNVNSVKLELNASFEEEVAVNVNADIDDDWEWYVFIPILEEVTCDISVDIRNFTAAHLAIQMYSILDEYDEKKWEAYRKSTEPQEIKDDLRELNNLEAEAEKEQDKSALESIKEQIKKIKEDLPNVKVLEKEYTFEEIWDELEKEDVADAFSNGKSKNQDEANLFMERLMDKYSTMIQSGTDWVELVNVNLLNYQYNIYCIAIRLKGDFVIRTQANVSIGSNVEYQVGKRYNFWIKILSGQSGSSEMDLIDERFGFQFYVMGSLALRAGIKLSVDIGLISADLASVGANIEFGPYMRMYGYFCYVYTKYRPKNTDNWEDDKEMAGALFFEFGLYMVMNFKAQILNDAKSYEKTLIDKEWPLLTAGQKTSVYGFANGIGMDEVLVIRDEDDDSRNGITMKVPESYLQMKTMMLLTGEKKQEAHERSNYIYSVSDKKFSVDKNGVITVNPSDTERYLTAELTITWKNSKYAFSKYDMTVKVPIVWTNMTTEEINEKFTASVAVGNLTDGYSIVWSEKYGRLDTFDLPSEEEVLEIIGYANFNDGNTNLKYSEVGGYQSESTDISITSDRVFYFDITRREYSIKVNGIQNQSGNTESATYTATYGEKFDFSNLKYTGANNPDKILYTEFLNLTLDTDDTTVFDLNSTVDRTYAGKYGTSAEVTANYLDNTNEAVFTFVGINAPDVTVRFENNQIPYFEGISEYVEQYGGQGAKIDNISPVLVKMNSSIKYVVKCSLAIPAPKYTITFDTNGGNKIKAGEYTENSIIFRPTNPVRTGYTFEGWYSDEKYNDMFVFEGNSMPGKNITVYAKWSANTYNVRLISEGEVVDSFTVTYDSEYGTLKSPEKRDDFRFEGWCTDTSYNTQINENTIFTETEDVILHAKWVEKDVISESEIRAAQSQLVKTYNEAIHTYSVKLPSKYSGITGFVVEYKKEGTDKWSNGAQNAGIYSIRITRPNCDEYKQFNEVVIDRMLVINKANLSLGTVKAYRLGKNVVVSLPDGAKGDGKVTYYCGSSSNSTGFFRNVEGNPTCYVVIGAGTNYNSATSGKTSGIQNLGNYQNGSCNVKLKTVTASNGTDGAVYGAIIFNTKTTGWTKMNNSGDNDFQHNETDTYNIYSGTEEPWQITGYKLDIDPAGLAWFPKLTLSSVTVCVTDNSGIDWSAKYNKSETIKSDPISFTMTDFKRNVTGTGNLKTTAGAASWNINDGKDYTFNYDGKITDQYLTYNPFVRYDSPTFTVTSGNAEYDKFIRFTGVTTFKVDGNALRNYVKVNGGNNFTYTVKLTMPSDTSRGTTTFTTNISVNVKDYINGLNSVNTTSIKDTDAIKSQALKRAADMESRTTYDNFSATSYIDAAEDVYNSIASLETENAKVVNVPISITDKASAWGILVDVKYNKSALKLIGYEYGDVFVEDEFTVQKDMMKDRFKFLAVNSSLEDKELKDNVLTLKFAKLRDDAPTDSYKVVTGLIQAVNVDAENVNVKFNKYFTAHTPQDVADSQKDKHNDNMNYEGKSESDNSGVVGIYAEITDREENSGEKTNVNSEADAEVNKSGAESGNSENRENIMADNSGDIASNDDVKSDSLDEDSKLDKEDSKEASAITKEEPNNWGFVIVIFIILFAAGFCGVVVFARKKKM